MEGVVEDRNKTPFLDERWGFAFSWTQKLIIAGENVSIFYWQGGNVVEIMHFTIAGEGIKPFGLGG
jgi:hypothetical protein